MANTLLADTKQNKSLPFSNSLNRAQRGPIKFCLRSSLQIKKNIQILFCFSPGQPLLPNPDVQSSDPKYHDFTSAKKMCIAMHNHIYQTTPIKLQKNYPFQNTVIGVDNQSSECDKIVSAKMKLVEQ